MEREDACAFVLETIFWKRFEFWRAASPKLPRKTFCIPLSERGALVLSRVLAWRFVRTPPSKVSIALFCSRRRPTSFSEYPRFGFSPDLALSVSGMVDARLLFVSWDN